MKRKSLIGSGLGFTSILLLLGVAMAATTASTGFSSLDERTDCPGKVTCAINGEEVCKDQCPLIDAGRSDCPGKLECPLTGDLVCRDQCPLGATTDIAGLENDVPPCCRSKK